MVISAGSGNLSTFDVGSLFLLKREFGFGISIIFLDYYSGGSMVTLILGLFANSMLIKDYLSSSDALEGVTNNCGSLYFRGAAYVN